MQLDAGSAFPLGATLDENGINFAIHSVDAEYIELCLFVDNLPEIRIPLHRTENIWHGYLARANAPYAVSGLRYGFRVFGEFNPQQGKRFNGQKLLLDPYAKKLDSTPKDHPSHYGGAVKPNFLNSAPFMAKSVVTPPSQYAFLAEPPKHAWGNTVIYEAHVRGLTQQHPDIPENIRGTYRAIVHPVMLAHYKKVGITAIELLPIAHHVDEPRLQHLGLSNYWGYNTLAHFALEPTYASGLEGLTAEEEFCYVVDTLHANGIEVILDVVFNHTAELDEKGPTFSFRGIDNAHAYWLQDSGHYDNLTGCGNALHLQQPAMQEYVLECLRYWITTYQVDGFRFDLATLLGRTPSFDPNAPLLKAMIADPIINSVKLIAEPWDVGLGGYQVGEFPDPFIDWNDAYRDVMRQFWLQPTISLGEFAQHFAASRQRFSKRKSPFSTLNFITAHDGFTLLDCVSYNEKHNHANGEENRDGTSNNHSFNHGAEGDTSDKQIIAARRVSQKALLATLLLSQGTPMLLAGDELNNGQLGNNNAYCQNNPIAWLDWQKSSKQANDAVLKDDELAQWVAELIKLRKQIPALVDDSLWQNAQQVMWLDQEACSLDAETWQNPNVPILQIVLSEIWLIVINRSHDTHTVQLPKVHETVSAEVTGESSWQPTKIVTSQCSINADNTVNCPRGIYVFKYETRSR